MRPSFLGVSDMKQITLLTLVAVLSGCAVVGDYPDSKAGPDKALVCHKGKKTLEVSEAAVGAHLKHGDQRGAC
jgi:hypothetical protein